MSLPWIKFSPLAWRGDQALRMCGIAARGLWIECLCIMHEAKPYGHLIHNGRPVGAAALASMTGVPVDEVRSLLDELRQAGVLSLTGEGVIFSRRMVRDQEKSVKGRKAANLRWDKRPEFRAKNGPPNGSPIAPPNAKKREERKTPNQEEEASTRVLTSIRGGRG